MRIELGILPVFLFLCLCVRVINCVQFWYDCSEITVKKYTIKKNLKNLPTEKKKKKNE